MKQEQVPRKKSGGESEEIRNARRRGWEDCNRGISKSRNPHARGSDESIAWIEGWETRYYNEPREAW